MSEIDDSARDEGCCGYIGDGRETPCQLTEGWGYENTDAGLCRNHSNRGGQDGNQNAVGNSGGGAPERNGNAATHGAYRENFLEDHMTDEEAGRVATVEGLLSTSEGSERVARMMAAVALEQFRRSENAHFLAEFRRLCEKAGIFPDEENDHNHRHAHKHERETRELTERELRAIDSITGGPETIDAGTDEPADWSQDIDTDDDADDLDEADAEEEEDDDEGGGLTVGW